MISRKIKVWNLEAALDPRVPASSLCLRTLKVIVVHKRAHGIVILGS